MKLEAHLEIVNDLASKKGYKKNPSIYCQLSLAKDPNSGKCYLIVNNNKKPNPDKYRISNNVEKIFCKFVHEGKATLVLKEPNFSLAIQKANVNQLKIFLKIVHIANTTDDYQEELNKIQSKIAETKVNESKPSSKPLIGKLDSSQQFKKPTTSLIIKSRSEYLTNYKAVISQNLKLKTTIGNIPSVNLVKLVINNCELKSIDSSIFDFCQLNHLDLSNNKLISIENFKFGSLLELNLSQNEIKHIGLNCYLPKLINLDLSYNHLTCLDRNFCINFRNVTRLKLNNNKLKHIYVKIGDLMINLKHLYANNNELVNLPFSFSHLRLEMLELHDNPFEYIIFSNNISQNSDSTQSNFPTLLELCARKILNKKIKYGPRDIPRELIEYMNKNYDCVCGSSCFQYNFRLTVMFDLNRIAKSFTYLNINGVTDNQLPLKMYLCSFKCYIKNSRLKTLW